MGSSGPFPRFVVVPCRTTVRLFAVIYAHSSQHGFPFATEKMARTSHAPYDTEALCRWMEEDGVMWRDFVATARAAGTSVVEYMISEGRKRSERARRRLDEIELEKVTRWRSGCGCAVSWATFLIKSGRDVKQGVRGSESATSICLKRYVFLFVRCPLVD